MSALIAHYNDTPFWISAGTNKDDLECPMARLAYNVRMLWLSEVTMPD